MLVSLLLAQVSGVAVVGEFVARGMIVRPDTHVTEARDSARYTGYLRRFVSRLVG